LGCNLCGCMDIVPRLVIGIGLPSNSFVPVSFRRIPILQLKMASFVNGHGHHALRIWFWMTIIAKAISVINGSSFGLSDEVSLGNLDGVSFRNLDGVGETATVHRMSNRLAVSQLASAIVVRSLDPAGSTSLVLAKQRSESIAVWIVPSSRHSAYYGDYIKHHIDGSSIAIVISLSPSLPLSLSLFPSFPPSLGPIFAGQFTVAIISFSPSLGPIFALHLLRLFAI